MTILTDLKKNCTGNEYVFYYVMELLFSLQERFKDEQLASLSARMRRLQEEIERVVIWNQDVNMPSALLNTSTSFAWTLVGEKSLALTLPAHVRARPSTQNLLKLLLEVLSGGSHTSSILDPLLKSLSFK